MPDLLMNESRQTALRSLLALEPVPGDPLPPRRVFDALARLVPCDVYGASLTDLHGRTLGLATWTLSADRRTKHVPSPWPAPDPVGEDGPFHIGWVHWTRNPAMAEACNGMLGVDDLSIGFRNGTDHVVQLDFIRESRVFSEDELALLRMLVPVFGRLVRERPTPQLPATLTISERRVLHAVAAGQSNPDIAACFNVAESTVRKHLENSYRKLGVSNRMAAVSRLRGADSGRVDLEERLQTYA
jgi:DNA-binding CsgD family transcriptional regulator